MLTGSEDQEIEEEDEEGQEEEEEEEEDEEEGDKQNLRLERGLRTETIKNPVLRRKMISREMRKEKAGKGTDGEREGTKKG